MEYIKSLKMKNIYIKEGAAIAMTADSSLHSGMAGETRNQPF